MAYKKHTNHSKQRGNVFTFLFGAVAIVGIVTASTMQLISGPIRTASRVNAINLTESQLLAAGKIIILDAVTQSNDGDVDIDGTIEPREYTTVASGGIQGGGSIPTTIGATRSDAWGTLYGYCVWDAGSVDNGKNDAGTGTDNRLNGANNDTDTVIAVISAGPNQAFETGCLAFNGSGDDGVFRVSGSDDLIMTWSYAEARSASSDLWDIKSGTPDTAEIGKDLEVFDPGNANTVTAKIDRVTGIGDFLGITTDLITAKTTEISVKSPMTILKSVAPTSGKYALDVLPNSTVSQLIARFGASGGTDGLTIGQTATGAMNYAFEAGNVGIGNTDPIYKLQITETMTDTSGTDAPLYISGTNAPAGASSLITYGSYVTNVYTGTQTSTGIVHGGYNSALNQATSGTLSGLYGVVNLSENESTGTVNNMTGAYNVAKNSGAGSANNLFAARNQINNTGSGTISNAYGSYNQASTTAGTITKLSGTYSSTTTSSAANVSTLTGVENYTYNAAGVATDIYGINNVIRSNVSDAGTIDNFIGIYSYNYKAGTKTTNNNWGIYNYTSSKGTVNNSVRGIFNYVRSVESGGAVAPEYSGIYNELYLSGNATITNAYGIRSRLTAFGGMTIGNYYGLYFDTVSSPPTTYWALYNASTMQSYFGGNVGIGSGKTVPSYSLDTSGSIRANTTVYTSDARLKKDVATIDQGLDSVLKLRGVTFNWITPSNDDQKGRQIGLIAQEIEEVYPELVLTDNEGMKSVNYPGLVAPLIEAVKTVWAKITDMLDVIESLTKRIVTLEAQNQSLEDRIERLEASTQPAP